MLIIKTDFNIVLENWLSKKNYSQIFVLVDENTKTVCLPLLKLKLPFKCIEIQSGEKHKTLITCQKIWKGLLDANADRNALFINLGGGVICDMGAFCASTYKRGIDFINIPTSLLAQVDASVGSKTGIDFLGQKNMIGLFSDAVEVFIYTKFIDTLPKRQIKSGIGEVLKHGLIKDKSYFEHFYNNYMNNIFNIGAIVKRSIEIKSEIVQADKKESGQRKILNFGHTIGHALESYSLKFHKNPLLHGEAVALGMIAELYISSKKANMPYSEADFISTKILHFYDFTNIEAFDYEALIPFMLNDKKSSRNKIKCVLLTSIGKAIFDQEINREDIELSLNYLKEKIDNA